MMPRTFALRLVSLAVIAALVAFVLIAFQGVGKAHSQVPPPATPTPANATNGISNLQCGISPAPFALDTPETLTCTFNFFGTPHTLVVKFEISTTTPPLGLQVTSCTLDASAIHVGPCP